MSKTISVSEINTYGTCARKWHLTYKQNLVRLAEDVGPARLGTIVHEALKVVMRYYYDRQLDGVSPDMEKVTQLAAWAVKAWDRSNRPIKTITNFVDHSTIKDTVFEARWDEVIASATLLAVETVKHLKFSERYTILDTDALLPGYRPSERVPLIEYRFEYPLENTDMLFVGIVDVVVQDKKTGHVIAIDWKTRKEFIDYDTEYLNQQIGLYQYVLRQQGLPITQGVSYQIKSTVHPPKLNKPNKKTGIAAMSRRNITTTWDIYKQALLDNGLDPADYQDMRETLSHNELFRPLVVYRSEAMLQNLWANVLSHVYRMVQDTTYPLYLGYACYTCPFKPICRATMDSHDPSEIIEGGYTARKVDLDGLRDYVD